MKLVYCWKIQEQPVKGSITLVNFRTQFWMVHCISSIVLCKCPANQFTSIWWTKIIPIDWRQSLWENFIYCLDENKLKRVHDEKKQKELRMVFREKSSWKVYCLVAIRYWKQQQVLWVAVKVNLKKAFLEAVWILQAGGGILPGKDVLVSSDANDNGSIKWRLL